MSEQTLLDFYFRGDFSTCVQIDRAGLNEYLARFQHQDEILGRVDLSVKTNFDRVLDRALSLNNEKLVRFKPPPTEDRLSAAYSSINDAIERIGRLQISGTARITDVVVDSTPASRVEILIFADNICVDALIRHFAKDKHLDEIIRVYVMISLNHRLVQYQNKVLATGLATNPAIVYSDIDFDNVASRIEFFAFICQDNGLVTADMITTHIHRGREFVRGTLGECGYSFADLERVSNSDGILGDEDSIVHGGPLTTYSCLLIKVLLSGVHAMV